MALMSSPLPAMFVFQHSEPIASGRLGRAMYSPRYSPPIGLFPGALQKSLREAHRAPWRNTSTQWRSPFLHRPIWPYCPRQIPSSDGGIWPDHFSQLLSDGSSMRHENACRILAWTSFRLFMTLAMASQRKSYRPI